MKSFCTAIVKEFLELERGFSSLGFDRSNNGVTLGDNFWVIFGETTQFGYIGCALDDVAVLDQPSRGLWKEVDEDKNNEGGNLRIISISYLNMTQRGACTNCIPTGVLH